MIPPDVLNELVAEENLSPAEQEVLSLALDGKSPTEIQRLLGIESQNAVQKRLGKIYAKFRLAGAGPGKLAKLQKILTDRYQLKLGKKKVLIFWFSKTGRTIAEELIDIFKHPQIEASISEVDINSSSLRLAEITQSLEGINYGIICLTSGFSQNSWVNFAIGFLSGKVNNFKLIRFSRENLTEPLLHFPIIDGTSEDSLAQLFHEITATDIQEAKAWINFKLANANWWQEIIQKKQEQPIKHESLDYQLIVKAGQQILKDNKYFQTNKLFQKIILDVLTDVCNQIEDVGLNGSVYSIPLELYPRYLVSLQKDQDIQPRVQAVSIVGYVEHFWANDRGDEVGKTANKESERIFIFQDIEEYKKSKNFLLEHASLYKVYMMMIDAYEPLAQEFYNDFKLTKWQDEDYSLPTKQYAILEAPDNSQLLVWYNEDNLKDTRNKRFVNFSAIPEQVALYKEAFDIIKCSQDVIPLHIENTEKITNTFKEVEQRLSQQVLASKIHITPEQLLEDLQKVRNELLSLTDENEVIDKALNFVRKTLHSQTAAIFMFGKDGRLHRKGIQGIDVKRKPIDNQWFATESYAIGESFTGKTALSQEKEGFGKPQCSNKLNEEDLDSKSQVEYSKKLGKINCGLAVPLNGQNKTYGVLEIINKIHHSTGKPLNYCGFTQNEIYWLSAIASAVATALSNIRRNRQNQLESDISSFLVNYQQNEEKAYDEVVSRLISEHTAFEVCILRIKNQADILEIKAKKSVSRIFNWEHRKNEGIKLGEGIVGKVLESGKPVIIEKISKDIDKFKNKQWVVENKFKSFGCFPLIYQTEVVGTLSLYAAYEYNFHWSCREFLNRVCSLIAAFIGREKEEREVRKFVSKSCNNTLNQPIDLIKELDSIYTPSPKTEKNSSDEVASVPVLD
ncbi:MAG: GAF domain-containing protein [Fischerella sp. CENA71]|nr:GAF domain-containing protein [Fischerella sp. CENA71]